MHAENNVRTYVQLKHNRRIGSHLRPFERMQRTGAPAAQCDVALCRRNVWQPLLLGFGSFVPPRLESAPPAPTHLPSPPKGTPKVADACFLQAGSCGLTIGARNTNALVMARHMVRETTEVSIPAIVLSLLLSLLVAEMTAVQLCCYKYHRTHCCSLYTWNGATADVGKSFPLASCFRLSQRGKQEDRIGPRAADRSQSYEVC